MTSYHGVLLSLQTSMSVRMVMTTVMRMQTALTQREVSPAPVTLATLEMESAAQVNYIIILVTVISCFRVSSV